MYLTWLSVGNGEIWDSLQCIYHINLNIIQRRVKSRILPYLILEDLLVYESYIEGKMTKRLFTTKGYRAKEYLELVHIDIYVLKKFESDENNFKMDTILFTFNEVYI